MNRRHIKASKDRTHYPTGHSAFANKKRNLVSRDIIRTCISINPNCKNMPLTLLRENARKT